MQANTSYKSFSPVQVSADIGLHIGLAGVNITLRGESVSPSAPLQWPQQLHSCPAGSLGLEAPGPCCARAAAAGSAQGWHSRNSASASRRKPSGADQRDHQLQ